MKKKIFSLCLICICLFTLFLPVVGAEEYNNVEELVSDVQEVVNVSEQDIQMVNVGERSSVAPSEGDVSASELALLSSIALAVNNIQAGTLFNINSTQVSYFKGILLEDPFADYVITFDGNYQYDLYYGHNLEVGESCNHARIYRVQTGSGYSYDYVTITGDTANLPNSNVYVSTITEGYPILQEVENAKYQKILFVAFGVALGLWVLSKIFFR